MSEAAVKQAVDNHVVDLGLTRNAAGVEEQIQNATNGYGADAVIIYAATRHSEPANNALNVCRRKGRVVVVTSSQHMRSPRFSSNTVPRRLSTPTRNAACKLRMI